MVVIPSFRQLVITLSQLVITLVHLDVGCTLEIMWPRNIQNGFEIFRASLGFEPGMKISIKKYLERALKSRFPGNTCIQNRNKFNFSYLSPF